MSATSARPVPTTDADTLAEPSWTAGDVISAPDRLRLDKARAHLATAADAIDGWYARQTTTEHTYVHDGHNAIQLIDAATRELHRVRAVLIGELRADEDERAERVDRMIAESRTRRAGVAPGKPDGGPRRDGGAA